MRNLLTLITLILITNNAWSAPKYKTERFNKAIETIEESLVENEWSSEFEFKYEVLTFERWVDIGPHAMKTLSSFTGILDIDFKTFVYDRYSSSERVRKLTNKIKGGHFCENFVKNLWGDHNQSRFRECAFKVSNILEEAINEDTTIGYLSIFGEEWGDYEYQVFYLQDNATKEVLVLSFDMLHEV